MYVENLVAPFAWSHSLLIRLLVTICDAMDGFLRQGLTSFAFQAHQRNELQCSLPRTCSPEIFRTYLLCMTVALRWMRAYIAGILIGGVSLYDAVERLRFVRAKHPVITKAASRGFCSGSYRRSFLGRTSGYVLFYQPGAITSSNPAQILRNFWRADVRSTARRLGDFLQCHRVTKTAWQSAQFSTGDVVASGSRPACFLGVCKFINAELGPPDVTCRGPCAFPTVRTAD